MVDDAVIFKDASLSVNKQIEDAAFVTGSEGGT